MKIEEIAWKVFGENLEELGVEYVSDLVAIGTCDLGAEETSGVEDVQGSHQPFYSNAKISMRDTTSLSSRQVLLKSLSGDSASSTEVPSTVFATSEESSTSVSTSTEESNPRFSSSAPPVGNNLV